MMEKEKSNFNRRQFLKRSIQVASISIVPRYVLGGIGYTAPSDVINLGFIGTGKQGKGLGGRFMKIQDCRIVANAEVDSKKKESFAGYIETFYSDTIGKSEVTQYVEYKDLLSRDDIDAVVIATPDHWHALNAINSLQAGKDVFCEKPMAHTVWEGRRMVEVTRENNRVFQTGSMQRSSFNFRRACELVRNGIIGDVKHIKVSVGDPAILDDPAFPHARADGAHLQFHNRRRGDTETLRNTRERKRYGDSTPMLHTRNAGTGHHPHRLRDQRHH